MNHTTLALVLCLFFFATFSTAQSYSWLQIAIYGSNPTCSGNQVTQYILYNLDSCIHNIDNDTYPYNKFTCDGSQTVYWDCTDSNCQNCVSDGAGETLNVCSTDEVGGDGQIFSCFVDQEWSFDNYTFTSGPSGASLNYDHSQCSGDPYAVLISALPTSCDSSGVKWSCENGEVFKYECDTNCANCQKTSFSVCIEDSTYNTSSTNECPGASKASKVAGFSLLVIFVAFALLVY